MSRAWGLRAELKARGGGDAGTSLTTSNEEIGPQPPCAQRVPSAAWVSASLALLDNVPALPASRRLASAHAALGTRHILILGQAPRAELLIESLSQKN